MTRRSLGFTVLALGLALPASALPATTVTGTYSITGAAGEQADWTVGGSFTRQRDGVVPSRLAKVVVPPQTTACSEGDPAAGTTTVTVDGVNSAAASQFFSITYDLRRKTAKVQFAPSPAAAGLVNRRTSASCVWNGGTVDSTVPTPLADVMTGSIATPRTWKVRRQITGAWTGSGTQRVYGQTHRMTFRLTGKALFLGSRCTLPTNAQVRGLRSLASVRSFLSSAGFTRPKMQVSMSRVVPKGRYTILERTAGETTALCGARTITLVRSTGMPAGPLFLPPAAAVPNPNAG